MVKILFYIVHALSYLPFWFWYGVSDILFVLTFYVFAYRKKVVLSNLDIVFPNKDAAEKHRIARRFYRNFTDFIVENIKSFSMSQASLRKRFAMSNIDEVTQYIAAHNGGAIISMSHQFNWEWMMNIEEKMPRQAHSVAAYTPLSNTVLDRMVKKNRERFGSSLLSSSKLPLFIKKLQDDGRWPFVGLVADQSPHASNKFWAPFFGVEVPVFSGLEVLSKRFGLSLWFMHVRKLMRGYYQAHFELIAPANHSLAKGELTMRYLAKVEEQIVAQPETYLWSHRRWKHAGKRPATK